MASKNIKLDGNTLPVREFKLDWMVQDPSICMIAKKGSGKSWVCRAIMKHFKDIPGGVIISPTDRMSSFYGKFFPELYIHYQYSTDLIEAILYRQDQIIEKAKQKAKEGKKCDPRAMLVMDDCLSSKGSWAKDQPVMELMFNGRHYKIMYILTMQFPLGLQPELRCNFDYIFLLAEDFQSNQKRIHEHYAGMFPSFESFKQTFIELTNDFGCMVIVNRGSRNSFLDKVFYYKADNELLDRVGNDQFNNMHKLNFDKKWRKRSVPFDIGTFANKKKNSRIKIEKLSSNMGRVRLQ